MFQDGICQQINQINGSGWRTQQDDDWIYYPQQYGIHAKLYQDIVWHF